MAGGDEARKGGQNQDMWDQTMKGGQDQDNKGSG